MAMNTTQPLSSLELTTAIPSRTIQSAADAIMHLIERERADVVQELVQERRRTFHLEQECQNLRRELEAERAGCGGVRVAGVQGGTFPTIQARPQENSPFYINFQPNREAQDNRQSLECSCGEEVQELKQKLAQTELFLNAYRSGRPLEIEKVFDVQKKRSSNKKGDFSLYCQSTNVELTRQSQTFIAQGERGTMDQKQAKTDNDEPSLQNKVNVADLKKELTNLHTTLEAQGLLFSSTKNAQGVAVILYNPEVHTVMQQIVGEAKRRNLIPDTMNIQALESGDIKLYEFAKLVSGIVSQARTIELQRTQALRAGLAQGWTVKQWFDAMVSFNAALKSGAVPKYMDGMGFP
ncbi:hypothetical protein FA15DRAFT_723772 [Coprinopsis marcescibilis]|uniref:Uncharacterized protein n=1 Tax=Coprinopsis marcescibilis TaxID=230819 RepID=A0A5C3KHS0_COPMA|nr:hypothetical protein FA15DRAFT_723772 [Coprinopsis marcescibilis]